MTISRMVSALAPAFLLWGQPSQALEFKVTAVSSLHFDLAAAKERPVSKVIGILKDMQTQLAKDAEDDEEVYNQLVCWCETNDREKTKSIKKATARIADLTAKLEDAFANSARLSSEIKALKKEVAKNKESLDQATALREQELAAFNAEEKDLLGSISALKAAIGVLSKHHKSLIQIQAPSTHVLGVAATLQHVMQKHAGLLQGVLSRSERNAALAFIQAPSYTSQSGEIFGILEQMHETFQSNLDSSRKQEAESQKAYEELKAAKEAEIKAGTEQLNAKSQELADTNELLAHGKEDIEDTKKTLAADQAFLASLKEKCEMADKEYEERVKARNVEIEAVSKAQAILSGDNAHDLFTRTFNPSLFQRKSSSTADARRRAHLAQLLSRAAQRYGSGQLAALSLAVRLDAFERVKKTISDMVTQLLHEKEDEIKHKDFCVAEFNANQEQTDTAEREKRELEASIAKLESDIQGLTSAIDQLKADVAEISAQLKKAGENREVENKEFQHEVADQRETQHILTQAKDVLAEVYKKAALLQQEPPASFSKYGSNGSGKGVVDLLESIIADAKAAEDETIRSEEDAQKAYEDFVQESNASIEAKNKDILNKSGEKAKKEADLVAAKEAKDNKVLELEFLSNYNAQLHESCDFVLKNFDMRQSARDEEVESLRQAIAILSGAKFD